MEAQGAIIRCLNLIRPKGYFFFTPALGDAARRGCNSIEHLIPATGLAQFRDRALAHPAALPPGPSEHDGAQVIFTTGSTGSPKPALLSHRGITCQNLCLATAFHFGPDQRVLCNLPPSLVGGQAEILMTSLFGGATAVTLEVFDAVRSLEAIEQHGVTLIGQIPAMFQLEWHTAEFARRNFSRLQFAIYGGQAVPHPFLDRMLQMAPRIATGLGLTEASGFCTYTALTPDAVDLERSGVGWAMPAYRLAIRQPMNAEGTAGAELPQGAVGHICFQGPQSFLGYVNDPAATAAALSKDGWLYTGDLGSSGEHGVHFSGRAKWVLKVAGRQVAVRPGRVPLRRVPFQRDPPPPDRDEAGGPVRCQAASPRLEFRRIQPRVLARALSSTPCPILCNPGVAINVGDSEFNGCRIVVQSQ